MIFMFQTWLNRKSFLVEVIILKLINAPHLLVERKSGDHILEQYLEWLYRLVSDSQFKVLKFINMTNSKLDWKLFSKDLQFICSSEDKHSEIDRKPLIEGSHPFSNNKCNLQLSRLNKTFKGIVIPKQRNH